jgi:hypothetical protein
MKMKAIREWWRRIDDFLRRCDAAADWDPLEYFDRRLSRRASCGIEYPITHTYTIAATKHL